MSEITVDQIMEWEPCEYWPRERVEGLFAGAPWLTPRELYGRIGDGFPAADWLWVVLRPEIIPERQLHLLACVYAEDALMAERAAGREPHADSWAVIEAKRRWIRGEMSDKELAAARDAARDAAWDAARDAAGDAAWARQAEQAMAVIEASA